MKTIWLIANWKSNKTIEEALEWVGVVGPQLAKMDPSTGLRLRGHSDSRSLGLKVVVCPTFLAVEEVKKAVVVGNFPLLVGVQDLSPFSTGAHTGEEAAGLLAGIADLAIVGHAERRQQFGETDEMVAQKAQQALDNHIIPVVCVVDESTVIPGEVNMIAYEPVFAISSGTPDTADNANQVAGKIQQRVNQPLTVLYGGSVTAENARDYLMQSNLSGLLVGGASLRPESFLQIIRIVARLPNHD